ncbi:protelomerase family protein [Pantanalinema rosaneae CENA516]|uniref:protelomerase family protein n=1 Tax=Pantanalinema rosaneae TaxID=1620701 RepID=UPI003D6DF0B1
MDAVLLHHAAAQAKTGWLAEALITLLPEIWDLQTAMPQWQETASAWAAQIDRLFEEKKLITPTQQKNRRTDIANALRTIDPQHPVIPYILLSSEVYTALNNQQANRLNARENKFFSSQQANELVRRAIALLDSSVPNDMAAGLAVLVGRRIGEILISRFRPKTAYSLLFSEAVKRRGSVGLEFEIPTLAPADRVLVAIEDLKQIWNIQDLKALNLADNHLKRRINARYSGVPDACRQHFFDLVPGREAETDTGNRLYTHLFRAVYAEIATYYYKPDWVPDHRFKAEIQGHFKLTDDGQKIPNYSARQNYDDYLICDRSPGQPGIKLGTPGVEILAVFQRKVGADVEADATIAHQSLEPGTINALLYRAVDRLLFSKQWAEVITGLVLVTGQPVKALLKTDPKEKSSFSILLDGREVPTLTTASQVVAGWKRLAQLSPLPLSQLETAVREICDLTFQDLAPVRSLQALREVYAAIALHWFCPPDVEETVFLQTIAAVEPAGFATVNPDRGIKLGQRQIDRLELLNAVVEDADMSEEFADAIAPQPNPQAKSRHRRKTLSVDADLLRTVAATFGITIRGKGGAGGLSYEAALTQILGQLAQGQPVPTAQPITMPPEDAGTIAALKDQAKTLAWFTGQLEILEQQVKTLTQERDRALAQVNSQVDSSELEQLRQENQQLKRERDQATAKLQTFKQLLMETGMPEEKDAVIPESQLSPQPIVTLSPMPLAIPQPDPAKPKPSRKRMPEEEALQHIRTAIQAIMRFNDQEGRAFDDMWYISFPVLQTLLRSNGLSANQKTVAIVFEQMQAELEQHHDKHQIGSRHNRRHPDIEKIVEAVTLELGEANSELDHTL